MVSRIIRRVLPAAFVLALCFAMLMPGTALAAATKCESYITGDDAAAQAYGVNWFAQTFTATSSHTTSCIKLKLYRTGTPGTVTASLRRTDEGDITGSDLTSGTISGDECTTETAGEWYTFTLTEVELEDDAQYGIVLRATGGDSDNSIHWRYNSAGSYSGGKYLSSTDSGEGWTGDDAKDFMFESWGDATLEIVDVKVFASVIEDGDWLFLIHYKCQVPPPFPGEDPREYFNIAVYCESDPVAQTKLAQWGYMPGSIYLSREATSELYWGLDGITVVIEGNSERWEEPPGVGYSLVYADWRGANLFYLDEWVRDIAQDIEGFYNVDMYTETVGEVTLPAGEGVLTQIGGEIFLAGIPGLDELRPHLFFVTTHEPEAPDGDWTHEYEETLTWEDQVGPQVADMLNTWGDVVNISGKLFGGVLIFIGYLGVVVVGTMKTKTPVIATTAAIPVLLGGWWLGIIPLALAAILSMMMLLFSIWIVWFRGT